MEGYGQNLSPPIFNDVERHRDVTEREEGRNGGWEFVRREI